MTKFTGTKRTEIMTKLYAIYGASGCGRSLMPVARQQLAASSR